MKTIKTLAKYLKGYWNVTILTWIFVTFEVICEVLVPFCMQYLVNAIKVPDLNLIWLMGGLMIGLSLLSCVFGAIAGYFAAASSAGFAKNLRKGMYYHIQDFSFNNIDRFSTSSLITRLTTDVTNVQNAFQMIIRIAIRAPLMLVFALIMSFVTQWRVAWIFVVIIPFIFALLIFIGAKVHPTFVKVFNKYDELNETVQEDIQGIRVVKSFNREDFQKEKFGKISEFIYVNFSHAEKVLAFNNPIMQIAIYGSIIGVSYLGALLIVRQPLDMNVGQLTSLITYVMQIMMALMMLSMVFVLIIIARNSAERIVEVVKEKPDLASPENPLTAIKDGSVDFTDVCFRYNASGDKDVLNNINLHVPSGSTIGILGMTGSAKTTLISLIARLYDVSSGSVKVGGEDVRRYDLSFLRDQVAVVLQKNTLFTGTIAENLRWGNPDASDDQLVQAAKLAQADDFIEKMPDKYNTMIVEGGTNVSGGQKERICIARALLKSPKIIILDDSTNAVDTHTDALIRAAFMKDLPDVTKFIVTQRILSIKDCDKIILLDDGHIVDEGSNDELLAKSQVYKELCAAQMNGGGDFDVKE